ncbi:hypothetical protein GCM10027273_33720 [Nocardioides pakistanensis]
MKSPEDPWVIESPTIKMRGGVASCALETAGDEVATTTSANTAASNLPTRAPKADDPRLTSCPDLP